MDTNEVLSTLFQVVIIPLLTVLTGFAVKWINAKAEEIKAKTSNGLFQKYLGMLDEAITSAVIAVNQTYVDALKEQGAFDGEAQKEAFNRVYDTIILTLNEDATRCLQEVIGDLNSYITNRIEEEVKTYKLNIYYDKKV